MMSLGELIGKEFGIETKVGAEYVKANSEKKKRKSVGIKNEELVIMFKDIENSFTGKFANSDLKDLCAKWGLTNRQTPSRLKKLAEQGLLIRYETTPLTYQVK